MTVALVNDQMPVGAVRLDELPRFIRPKGRQNGQPSRYWHVPRSAYRHTPLWSDRPHIFVSLFCGQSRWFDLAELPLLVTDRQPVEDLCGTCDGRAAGVDPADTLRRFQPRDLLADPPYCPCKHPKLDDYRVCALCLAPVRAASGWNAWGLANHRPGEGLARFEPCEFHGWRDVSCSISADRTSGHAFCTQYDCDWKVQL